MVRVMPWRGGVNSKAIAISFSVFWACVNVTQSPPPAPVVVAEFDPGATVPVVPSPNDLAREPTTGRILVPETPGESLAQRELELGYLGALTGFPFESTAEAHFSGDLDASSVGASSVLAFDLVTQAPIAVGATYDSARRAIVVVPQGGAWKRAHAYAVVLVGGPNGLRGALGEPVVGSPTWALVSSSTSLVTCADLAAADCRPAVDVIPSAETDPAARIADQTAKAIQLEKLRRLYAPVLDALAQQGLPRDVVALAWTFTILDAGEATFDPANQVVPFPNDVLRPGGKVTLPNPITGQPLAAADCAAPANPMIAMTCGLNTLDGFSTTAPLVSESSDGLGAAMQATLDASSLARGVGLVPLASLAPASERSAPKFTACLNCLSTPDENGVPQTSPQQLQWKLDAPLDEKTTYLAYVTSDVLDDRGKALVANPVFAMLRLVNPLVDGGRSTVSLLTDAQAAQLEPLRLAMKPALDALERAGVARTSLALAFAFTTQSESAVLDQLYWYPTILGDALPAAPLWVTDATPIYKARAQAAGVPLAAVGKVLVGSLVTPIAVTGPSGTLDPSNPRVDQAPFVLYLPATPPPAAGYPIAIFGHGFTRSKSDSLALANALASAGRASIAIDQLFHGDRASCTGSRAATMQPTDDASCANPFTQQCNEDPLVGRCVARSSATRAACGASPGDPSGDLACAAQGQGRCVASDHACEGGDFLRDASGRPVISGWNLLSLENFFATRDNLRQQVIDLAQLERVIVGQGPGSLASLVGAGFDPTAMGYVGQSLGAIEGSLFGAVSLRTSRVALSAPGGSLVGLVTTAPAFAAQKAALLAQLGALGLHPGTPSFDRTLGIAQWILDPADPVNVGARLAHTSGHAAFVQFIEGDQVIPTASTLAFVASANRGMTLSPPSYGCASPLFCYQFTQAGDGFDETSATPATRDGFLLQPPTGGAGLAITAKAQFQVATFLATGHP